MHAVSAAGYHLYSADMECAFVLMELPAVIDIARYSIHDALSDKRAVCASVYCTLTDNDRRYIAAPFNICFI